MFSTIKIAAAVAVLATTVVGQSSTTPVTGKLGDATVQKNNPAGVVCCNYLTCRRNRPLTFVQGIHC
jgi:hypothetical protein